MDEKKITGEWVLTHENEEKKQTEQEVRIERLSDSAYYRMYLNEVRTRSVASQEEQLAMYRSLLAGDESVMEAIVNSWLLRIIEMTKFYHGTPVQMEDVIQEGNMGLWMALSQLPQNLGEDEVEPYLVQSIRDAMENYIRESTGDTDQVQALVAKAALLYEAKEQLARENGEVPSLRQLSEYTHIPVDEIQDIFALFKEEEA